MGRLVSAMFACALLATGPAIAGPGGIGVAPVLVEVPVERGVGSLRVNNTRDVAVSFEVSTFRWTQADGVDVLDPTREILVAPSVFEIAPGSQQIVRIALAPAVRTRKVETPFRLIVRELPPPVRTQNGPTILLEMSVPVFASIRGAAPEFTARAAGASGVTLTNTGGAHARLLHVGAGGSSTSRTPRYLLPGASVTRPFPVSDGALRLTVADTAGLRASEQDIPVAAAVFAGDPVLRGR